MQETSHKIYDLLFQKHRHLPVVPKQILLSSFLQTPSQTLSCVPIFQQHLGFMLPLRRVLTPFPWPNLKAFTPSPFSKISPLHPVLHYSLFLQPVFPQPLPCACVFCLLCFLNSSFSIYSYTLCPHPFFFCGESGNLWVISLVSFSTLCVPPPLWAWWGQISIPKQWVVRMSLRNKVNLELW